MYRTTDKIQEQFRGMAFKCRVSYSIVFAQIEELCLQPLFLTTYP